MANTSIDLVGLDFNSLKDNLKTFLRNNTQFKDLDFEGSNISVLLDVLAYNSYLNAFYTNMVASEMFLDTAQLRDSVVSHAKELSYTPRSFTSAKATITVDITPATTVSSIVVPKYTSFTSRVGSNTYTFTTNESVVVTANTTGGYRFVTDVYEGGVVTDTFTINQSNTTQRFVLSNPTIDVSSLSVVVYEDNGQTTLTYNSAVDLSTVASNTHAFFTQAAENSQYEITFGDGVFGRIPKDGAVVAVKYRACSGELPNGASTFAVDGPIDGHVNIAVTPTTAASGGAVSEGIQSIKFNAPRSYRAQGRAVTVSDYEALLRAKFPDISSVHVYGGELVEPPQFGKVFIAVDSAVGDGTSQTAKSSYVQYLSDKTPTTITPIIIDPEFLYVSITTNIEYNINATKKSTSEIQTSVLAAISNYNTDVLDDFATTLYYSSLIKAIDAADTSIVGNSTEVFAIKRLNPSLTITNNIDYSIRNALALDEGIRASAMETHYGYVVTSTPFIYENTRCILVDDANGALFVAALQGTTINPLRRIGSVNYETGRVTIPSIAITSYSGPFIAIKHRTRSKNITSQLNTILTIDDNDIIVNISGVKV